MPRKAGPCISRELMALDTDIFSRTSFVDVLRRWREGKTGGEGVRRLNSDATRVAQEERRRGRVGNFLACFTFFLSKNKILYKPISTQIISNKAVFLRKTF